MASKSNKPRGLGRGLSALMSDVNADQPAATLRRAETHIPVERVHPNPDQPRRFFDESALADLAASIAEKGIIQPLIVRPKPNTPDNYEIVAGSAGGVPRSGRSCMKCPSSCASSTTLRSSKSRSSRTSSGPT